MPFWFTEQHFVCPKISADRRRHVLIFLSLFRLDAGLPPGDKVRPEVPSLRKGSALPGLHLSSKGLAPGGNVPQRRHWGADPPPSQDTGCCSYAYFGQDLCSEPAADSGFAEVRAKWSGER